MPAGAVAAPQAPGGHTWLSAGWAARAQGGGEGQLSTPLGPASAEDQVIPVHRHKVKQVDTPSCTQPPWSTLRCKQSGDNTACTTEVVSFLSPLCPLLPSPHPWSPSLPQRGSRPGQKGLPKPLPSAMCLVGKIQVRPRSGVSMIAYALGKRGLLIEKNLQVFWTIMMTRCCQCCASSAPSGLAGVQMHTNRGAAPTGLWGVAPVPMVALSWAVVPIRHSG